MGWNYREQEALHWVVFLEHDCDGVWNEALTVADEVFLDACVLVWYAKQDVCNSNEEQTAARTAFSDVGDAISEASQVKPVTGSIFQTLMAWMHT